MGSHEPHRVGGSEPVGACRILGIGEYGGDQPGERGVFVSVAGGNNGEDACSLSPASASAAFTAAASDKYDNRVSWSAYGKCIDGYAPGVGVLSTWIGSTTRSKSGTSMAAPHIAGIAALYKRKYGNVSSATIDSWIKNNASTGVIKSNPTGTPNRLVFKSTL